MKQQRAVQAQKPKRSTAPAPVEDNPLDRPWGVYQGPADQAWAPYANATGTNKDLLATIALAPKAKWFGAWISDDRIQAAVTDYVANTQAGDADALVQLAMFRMVPWEHEACGRLPTAAEAASYRLWTDRFAAGIGSAHAAVVVQPDGPFSLCAPGGPGVPAELIAYSVRKLSELPNTSVYIEIGAADWPAAGQGGVESVLRFLLPAGIEDARGVALNGTHYSGTVDEVARGAAVVEALADRGVGGKHFVVNTSSNGNPFPFGTYTGPDPDDAFVCRSLTGGGTCVALGIPPTTDVASARWGLPEQTRELAAKYADGYLWFGRPWLYRQNDPFVMDRALTLARFNRYRQ